MKKIPWFIIYPLALSLILSSCAKNLRNDLSCRELGEHATNAIEGEFSPMGDEQLLLIFGEEAPYEDYAIFASTPTEDIDEIGIFRAKDQAEAEKIAETLKEYVSETADGMRSFVMSYAPEEAKKLDTPEAFSVGNYAVYLILDKNDREVIKERIEEYLSEK
ncbi:MAG: DUF4358 domain-containing protein [Clostridia bacterium]|nr:DUF4358 domain-containing protein [Clostridia bacterium]